MAPTPFIAELSVWRPVPGYKKHEMLQLVGFNTIYRPTTNLARGEPLCSTYVVPGSAASAGLLRDGELGDDASASETHTRCDGERIIVQPGDIIGIRARNIGPVDADRHSSHHASSPMFLANTQDPVPPEILKLAPRQGTHLGHLVPTALGIPTKSGPPGTGPSYEQPLEYKVGDIVQPQPLLDMMRHTLAPKLQASEPGPPKDGGEMMSLSLAFAAIVHPINKVPVPTVAGHVLAETRVPIDDMLNSDRTPSILQPALYRLNQDLFYANGDSVAGIGVPYELQDQPRAAAALQVLLQRLGVERTRLDPLIFGSMPALPPAANFRSQDRATSSHVMDLRSGCTSGQLILPQGRSFSMGTASDDALAGGSSSTGPTGSLTTLSFVSRPQGPVVAAAYDPYSCCLYALRGKLVERGQTATDDASSAVASVTGDTPVAAASESRAGMSPALATPSTPAGAVSRANDLSSPTTELELYLISQPGRAGACSAVTYGVVSSSTSPSHLLDLASRFGKITSERQSSAAQGSAIRALTAYLYQRSVREACDRRWYDSLPPHKLAHGARVVIQLERGQSSLRHAMAAVGDGSSTSYLMNAVICERYPAKAACQAATDVRMEVGREHAVDGSDTVCVLDDFGQTWQVRMTQVVPAEGDTSASLGRRPLNQHDLERATAVHNNAPGWLGLHRGSKCATEATERMTTAELMLYRIVTGVTADATWDTIATATAAIAASGYVIVNTQFQELRQACAHFLSRVIRSRPKPTAGATVHALHNRAVHDAYGALVESAGAYFAASTDIVELFNNLLLPQDSTTARPTHSADVSWKAVTEGHNARQAPNWEGGVKFDLLQHLREVAAVNYLPPSGKRSGMQALLRTIHASLLKARSNANSSAPIVRYGSFLGRLIASVDPTHATTVRTTDSSDTSDEDPHTYKQFASLAASPHSTSAALANGSAELELQVKTRALIAEEAVSTLSSYYFDPVQLDQLLIWQVPKDAPAMQGVKTKLSPVHLGAQYTAALGLYFAACTSIVANSAICLQQLYLRQQQDWYDTSAGGRRNDTQASDDASAVAATLRQPLFTSLLQSVIWALELQHPFGLKNLVANGIEAVDVQKLLAEGDAQTDMLEQCAKCYSTLSEPLPTAMRTIASSFVLAWRRLVLVLDKLSPSISLSLPTATSSPIVALRDMAAVHMADLLHPRARLVIRPGSIREAMEPQAAETWQQRQQDAASAWTSSRLLAGGIAESDERSTRLASLAVLPQIQLEQDVQRMAQAFRDSTPRHTSDQQLQAFVWVMQQAAHQASIERKSKVARHRANRSWKSGTVHELERSFFAALVHLTGNTKRLNVAVRVFFEGHEDRSGAAATAVFNEGDAVEMSTQALLDVWHQTDPLLQELCTTSRVLRSWIADNKGDQNVSDFTKGIAAGIHKRCQFLLLVCPPRLHAEYGLADLASDARMLVTSDELDTDYLHESIDQNAMTGRTTLNRLALINHLSTPMQISPGNADTLQGAVVRSDQVRHSGSDEKSMACAEFCWPNGAVPALFALHNLATVVYDTDEVHPDLSSRARDTLLPSGVPPRIKVQAMNELKELLYRLKWLLSTHLVSKTEPLPMHLAASLTSPRQNSTRPTPTHAAPSPVRHISGRGASTPPPPTSGRRGSGSHGMPPLPTSVRRTQSNRARDRPFSPPNTAGRRSGGTPVSLVVDGDVVDEAVAIAKYTTRTTLVRLACVLVPLLSGVMLRAEFEVSVIQPEAMPQTPQSPISGTEASSTSTLMATLTKLLLRAIYKVSAQEEALHHRLKRQQRRLRRRRGRTSDSVAGNTEDITAQCKVTANIRPNAARHVLSAQLDEVYSAPVETPIAPASTSSTTPLCTLEFSIPPASVSRWRSFELFAHDFGASQSIKDIVLTVTAAHGDTAVARQMPVVVGRASKWVTLLRRSQLTYFGLPVDAAIGSIILSVMSTWQAGSSLSIAAVRIRAEPSTIMSPTPTAHSQPSAHATPARSQVTRGSGQPASPSPMHEAYPLAHHTTQVQGSSRHSVVWRRNMLSQHSLLTHLLQTSYSHGPTAPMSSRRSEISTPSMPLQALSPRSPYMSPARPPVRSPTSDSQSAHPGLPPLDLGESASFTGSPTRGHSSSWSDRRGGSPQGVSKRHHASASVDDPRAWSPPLPPSAASARSGIVPGGAADFLTPTSARHAGTASTGRSKPAQELKIDWVDLGVLSRVPVSSILSAVLFKLSTEVLYAKEEVAVDDSHSAGASASPTAEPMMNKRPAAQMSPIGLYMASSSNSNVDRTAKAVLRCLISDLRKAIKLRHRAARGAAMGNTPLSPLISGAATGSGSELQAPSLCALRVMHFSVQHPLVLSSLATSRSFFMLLALLRAGPSPLKLLLFRMLRLILPHRSPSEWDNLLGSRAQSLGTPTPAPESTPAFVSGVHHPVVSTIPQRRFRTERSASSSSASSASSADVGSPIRRLPFNQRRSGGVVGALLRLVGESFLAGRGIVQATSAVGEEAVAQSVLEQVWVRIQPAARAEANNASDVVLEKAVAQVSVRERLQSEVEIHSDRAKDTKDDATVTLDSKTDPNDDVTHPHGGTPGVVGASKHSDNAPSISIRQPHVSPINTHGDFLLAPMQDGQATGAMSPMANVVVDDEVSEEEEDIVLLSTEDFSREEARLLAAEAIQLTRTLVQSTPWRDAIQRWCTGALREAGGVFGANGSSPRERPRIVPLQTSPDATGASKYNTLPSPSTVTPSRVVSARRLTYILRRACAALALLGGFEDRLRLGCLAEWGAPNDQASAMNAEPGADQRARERVVVSSIDFDFVDDGAADKDSVSPRAGTRRQDRSRSVQRSASSGIMDHASFTPMAGQAVGGLATIQSPRAPPVRWSAPTPTSGNRQHQQVYGNSQLGTADGWSSDEEDRVLTKTRRQSHVGAAVGREPEERVNKFGSVLDGMSNVVELRSGTAQVLLLDASSLGVSADASANKEAKRAGSSSGNSMAIVPLSDLRCVEEVRPPTNLINFSDVEDIFLTTIESARDALVSQDTPMSPVEAYDDGWGNQFVRITPAASPTASPTQQAQNAPPPQPPIVVPQLASDVLCALLTAGFAELRLMACRALKCMLQPPPRGAVNQPNAPIPTAPVPRPMPFDGRAFTNISGQVTPRTTAVEGGMPVLRAFSFSNEDTDDGDSADATLPWDNAPLPVHLSWLDELPHMRGLLQALFMSTAQLPPNGHVQSEEAIQGWIRKDVQPKVGRLPFEAINRILSVVITSSLEGLSAAIADTVSKMESLKANLRQQQLDRPSTSDTRTNKQSNQADATSPKTSHWTARRPPLLAGVGSSASSASSGDEVDEVHAAGRSAHDHASSSADESGSAAAQHRLAAFDSVEIAENNDSINNSVLLRWNGRYHDHEDGALQSERETGALDDSTPMGFDDAVPEYIQQYPLEPAFHGPALSELYALWSQLDPMGHGVATVESVLQGVERAKHDADELGAISSASPSVLDLHANESSDSARVMTIGTSILQYHAIMTHPSLGKVEPFASARRRAVSFRRHSRPDEDAAEAAVAGESATSGGVGMLLAAITAAGAEGLCENLLLAYEDELAKLDATPEKHDKPSALARGLGVYDPVVQLLHQLADHQDHADGHGVDVTTGDWVASAPGSTLNMSQALAALNAAMPEVQMTSSQFLAAAGVSLGCRQRSPLRLQAARTEPLLCLGSAESQHYSVEHPMRTLCEPDNLPRPTLARPSDMLHRHDDADTLLSLDSVALIVVPADSLMAGVDLEPLDHAAKAATVIDPALVARGLSRAIKTQAKDIHTEAKKIVGTEPVVDTGAAPAGKPASEQSVIGTRLYPWGRMVHCRPEHVANHIRLAELSGVRVVLVSYQRSTDLEPEDLTGGPGCADGDSEVFEMGVQVPEQRHVAADDQRRWHRTTGFQDGTTDRFPKSIDDATEVMRSVLGATWHVPPTDPIHHTLFDFSAPPRVPVAMVHPNAVDRIATALLDQKRWSDRLCVGSFCDARLPVTGLWHPAVVYAVAPRPFGHWMRVAFVGLPLITWRWVERIADNNNGHGRDDGYLESSPTEVDGTVVTGEGNTTRWPRTPSGTDSAAGPAHLFAVASNPSASKLDEMSELAAQRAQQVRWGRNDIAPLGWMSTWDSKSYAFYAEWRLTSKRDIPLPEEVDAERVRQACRLLRGEYPHSIMSLAGLVSASAFIRNAVASAGHDREHADWLTESAIKRAMTEHLPDVGSMLTGIQQMPSDATVVCSALTASLLQMRDVPAAMGPAMKAIVDADVLQWAKDLRVGDVVDAKDTVDLWFDAHVMRVSDDRVFIRYVGWCRPHEPDKYDEWVSRDSARIQPRTTKIRDWKRMQAGDMVEFRDPAVRSMDWEREARILAVDRCAWACRVAESSPASRIRSRSSNGTRTISLHNYFTVACFATHGRSRGSRWWSISESEKARSGSLPVRPLSLTQAHPLLGILAALMQIDDYNAYRTRVGASGNLDAVDAAAEGEHNADPFQRDPLQLFSTRARASGSGVDSPMSGAQNNGGNFGGVSIASHDSSPQITLPRLRFGASSDSTDVPEHSAVEFDLRRLDWRQNGSVATNSRSPNLRRSATSGTPPRPTRSGEPRRLTSSESAEGHSSASASNSLNRTSSIASGLGASASGFHEDGAAPRVVVEQNQRLQASAAALQSALRFFSLPVDSSKTGSVASGADDDEGAHSVFHESFIIELLQSCELDTSRALGMLLLLARQSRDEDARWDQPAIGTGIVVGSSILQHMPPEAVRAAHGISSGTRAKSILQTHVMPDMVSEFGSDQFQLKAVARTAFGVRYSAHKQFASVLPDGLFENGQLQPSTFINDRAAATDDLEDTTICVWVYRQSPPEDASSVNHVLWHNAELPESALALNGPVVVGESVGAKWRDRAWYEGQVTCVHDPEPGSGAEQAVDIQFDDGDVEQNIPFSRLRQYGGPVEALQQRLTVSLNSGGYVSAELSNATDVTPRSTLLNRGASPGDGVSAVTDDKNPVPLQVWTHVAVSLSRAHGLRVFINGILAAHTTPGRLLPRSNIVELGRPCADLHHLDVFNRELTDAELSEVLKGQVGFAPPNFNTTAQVQPITRNRRRAERVSSVRSSHWNRLIAPSVEQRSAEEPVLEQARSWLTTPIELDTHPHAQELQQQLPMSILFPTEGAGPVRARAEVIAPPVPARWQPAARSRRSPSRQARARLNMTAEVRVLPNGAKSSYPAHTIRITHKVSYC